MVQSKKINLKVIKRKVSRAVIHIRASFNNTIISVSDIRGNVIAWSSSGSCGFKGSRKSTPFAAQTATEVVLKKAMEQGIKQIEVNISGPGSGREVAVRSIQNFGLGILSIKDVTLIPHNGCRPTKKRRV